MKPGLSLYSRILLWLVLNLLLVGALAIALLGLPFRGSIEALATGPLGDRAQAMAGQITSDIYDQPKSSIEALLAQFGQQAGVDVAILTAGGLPGAVHVTGTPTTLPEVVLREARPNRGPMHVRGPEDNRRPEGPPEGGPGGPRDFRPDRPLPPPGGPSNGPSEGPPQGDGAPRVFFVRSGSPPVYWVGVRLLPGTIARGGQRAGPGVLVFSTPSLWRAASLLGVTRWLPVIIGLGIFCAAFWYPLVRSITRALRKLTDTTEQIAQGNFTARAAVHRSDEIGRLGTAVNQMAGRLEAFVAGQKRFMGDIAHELCSPIARMQMSLGLLERHIDEAASPNATTALNDVREEVEQMTALVNELLAFTKSAIGPPGGEGGGGGGGSGGSGGALTLQSVNVLNLTRQVLERERATGLITLDIPDGLFVQASPDLLARALANLVRNALRYAPPNENAPIVIRAAESRPVTAPPNSVPGTRIAVSIEDSGPGVPADALDKLGEPFFRPETARTRESGGTGLGLAIVRTCAQASGGWVAFANRQPPASGFVATLWLQHSV